MEYIPCGTLESFLFMHHESSLPWIIRRRFFLEIANALDYLHNHDEHIPYVHGDLKPQNVLLTEALKVKLADFGASRKTIPDEVTEKSTYINLHGSTQEDESFQVVQYTPLYAAPECLKTPRTSSCLSMDVYSYGMVGYEVITRREVFHGANVHFDTLLHLIKTTGQKPDTRIFDNVESTLERNSQDLKIFLELSEIVQSCWQYKPSVRPTMSVVKKKLNDPLWRDRMYNNKVDQKAKALIALRKLNIQLPSIKQSSLSKKAKVRCILYHFYEFYIYTEQKSYFLNSLL